MCKLIKENFMSKQSKAYACAVKASSFIYGNDKNKLNKDNIQKAINYLNEALYYCPNNQLSLDSLFHCYYLLNDLENMFIVAEDSLKVNCYSPIYSLSHYSIIHDIGNHIDHLIDLLKRGIEKNDNRCLLELGKVYMNPTYKNTVDYNKALEYLHKASLKKDTNYASARCFLGLCYLNMNKPKEGFANFVNAKNYGYSEANKYLAHLYRDGLGVKQDYDKYLEHLFAYLDVETANEIGSIYITNMYGVDNDLEVAEKYLTYVAERSNDYPADILIAAGFMLTHENYDERRLDNYLTRFFKLTENNADIQKEFDVIYQCFGQDIGDKLKTNASKYWKIEREAA